MFKKTLSTAVAVLSILAAVTITTAGTRVVNVNLFVAKAVADKIPNDKYGTSDPYQKAYNATSQMLNACAAKINAAVAGTSVDQLAFVVTSGVQPSTITDCYATYTSGVGVVPTSLNLYIDDKGDGRVSFCSPLNKIYFNWPANVLGGTFGSLATDGMIKFLLLSRGGMDLSGLQVAPAENPVSGKGWAMPQSFLGATYGASTIDPVNQKILQFCQEDFLTHTKKTQLHSAIPTQWVVFVKDSAGRSVNDANMSIYPAIFGQDKVSPVAIATGTSNNGEFAITKYALQLDVAPASNYGFTHSGFVVKAERNGYVSYGYLSLYDALNTGLHAQSAPLYSIEVVLPVDTTICTAIDAGVNNTTNQVKVGSNLFEIKNYPTWPFSAVVLAFTGVTKAMSGEVFVDGVSKGVLSGWYQTITVPTNGTTPVQVEIRNTSDAPFSFQWWVNAN